MPVTLPPGRLRLGTRPSLTGSPPVENTTGTVVVAALAANAGGTPAVNIAATERLTSSAANNGNRSNRSSAHRYRIVTFSPSM